MYWNRLTTTQRWLIVIGLLALFLRLGTVARQDHALGYIEDGGDSTWYLAYGHALAAGMEDGVMPGYAIDRYEDGYPVKLDGIPTPPLYLLLVGFPQLVFSREGAIVFIRLVQAVMSVMTCYFGFRMARTITGQASAGLLTGGLLAISPVFILESGRVTTETLFIFLLAWGLSHYLTAKTLKGFVVVGVLLGLATLTRAVLLLFPVGLALHLMLVHPRRKALQYCVALLLPYVLVVGSWTAYTWLRWDRLVIAGEGFAAFLYLGASEDGWQGPEATDAALAENAPLPTERDEQQEVYQEQAANIILSDPVAYLQRRVMALGDAYQQPHGTLYFSGESLRSLTSAWLQADFSLAGLGRLFQADAFWPKLALYIFHYGSLVLGAIGMVLSARQWRLTLPLIGYAAYTTVVHLFLDALPRYLFPTAIVWYVFTGIVLYTLWQRRGKAQTQA